MTSGPTQPTGLTRTSTMHLRSIIPLYMPLFEISPLLPFHIYVFHVDSVHCRVGHKTFTLLRSEIDSKGIYNLHLSDQIFIQLFHMLTII